MRPRHALGLIAALLLAPAACTPAEEEKIPDAPAGAPETPPPPGPVPAPADSAVEPAT